MLTITSDYFQSVGDPQPYLKRIAEAGFTHVHWCHEWATDRIYSADEIRQIGRWFKDYSMNPGSVVMDNTRSDYRMDYKPVPIATSRTFVGYHHCTS